MSIQERQKRRKNRALKELGLKPKKTKAQKEREKKYQKKYHKVYWPKYYAEHKEGIKENMRDYMKGKYQPIARREVRDEKLMKGCGV